LPELIRQSGETTVRGILKTHFISPVAFDILLRKPFTPADFETFIAERQRTIQDAIENLLIKERLDLSPQLRELDATEQLELKLRALVEKTLDADVSRVPSHVLQKVDERIARAVKKNAALDADRYEALAGKLEYFDFNPRIAISRLCLIPHLCAVRLSQLRGEVRNCPGRSSPDNRSRNNMRELRWSLGRPSGRIHSQILLGRASKTTRLTAGNAVAKAL
jgi:hypothetical protein